MTLSGPSSVGTWISAPSVAWAKLIGTWQIEIVAPPLEERVPLDHHLNSQVAPRRSDVSELALVAKLQPHAAFHAGWNIDLKLGSSRECGRRLGNWDRDR